MLIEACGWFKLRSLVVMAPRKATSRKAARARLLAAWSEAQKPTFSGVAKRTCESRDRAKTWCQKFEKGDVSLEDAPRTGRPLKLSAAEIARARRHLESTEHATLASATALVNAHRAEDDHVCAQTVRRHLNDGRSKGKVGHGPVARAKVSSMNKQKRKDATSRAAVKCLRARLHQLVFLDAAIVRWRAGKPIKAFRVQRGWSNKERPRPQDLQGYQPYQFYSAMTLGPDGMLYRHPLVFVPATHGLDAKCFRNKVAKPVLEWAKQLFGAEKFWFVQDNASPHTAKSTKKWMHDNHYELHVHPAQSPDLNRIEKAWAYLKAQLQRRRPRTEDGLFSIMQEVWMGLDASALKAFIHELPDVMKMVHDCPGKHVQT